MSTQLQRDKDDYTAKAQQHDRAIATANDSISSLHFQNLQILGIVQRNNQSMLARVQRQDELIVRLSRMLFLPL